MSAEFEVRQEFVQRFGCTSALAAAAAAKKTERNETKLQLNNFLWCFCVLFYFCVF